MRNGLRKICSVAAATMLATSIFSVTAFAEKPNASISQTEKAESSIKLYTEVDELAGVEFDSYDKLLKFISENKGKSKIESIDSAVSKFLLDSDCIYILDEYKDKTSEINKILITPTYISVNFVIKDVNYSLYHYYSISSGEKQINEAEKYYNEKRYSSGTASVKGNDVYFYERSLFNSKESYYIWKQSSKYFLLRVNRTINEADMELCFVKELSLMKNKTGWQTIDGNKYFFKKDGTAVTKSCVINGIRYKFSSDGVCQGKYTGWTKSANGRRYYKNGVMLKERWIKTKSGKKYYAGEDGYMRTGWARVDGKTCFFDENGVWDGKKYYKGYKPESMKYFLMDFDFSDDIEYEYCINYKKYYDFEGIDVVREILEAEKDEKFIFDNSSDDETELNEEIYRGGKQIIIRCATDTKTADKTPHIIFTKDKDGNSYFYCSQYGFGCKLSDSGAYDKIEESISQYTDITGWHRTDEGWRFYDEKSGEMSVGDVKINGNTYTFSADGIWNGFADYDNTKIYNTLNKKLSKDDYGGIYLDKNAVVVMSKNDSAVKKHTDELKKLYAPIVIRECEYSVNELETVREHLVKNQKKYGISAISTDVKNNRISVEMKKSNSKLNVYLDTLDDDNIVHIEYTDVVMTDD